MRELTDTCAEIELNNLVLKNNAHPCAMTPVCAILSKTKRRYGFVAERGGVWFGATKNEERRRDEPFISRYPTGIL